MRWPTWTTFSRFVRLTLGVALIVNEGMVRTSAQWDVLMVGLGLLTGPEAIRFDRWLDHYVAARGGQPPSPPTPPADPAPEAAT